MIMRRAWVPALLLLALQLAGLVGASTGPADLAPDTPVSQVLSLASEALAKGSASDALSYYDFAIQKDPKNYLTFFKRGATNLSLGRSAQALADFDRVLKIRPGFEGALLQRAKLKSRNGDWKSAHADYAAAGRTTDSEEVHALNDAETAAKAAKEASKKRNWEECVTQSSVALMTAAASLQLRNLRTRCRLEKGEIMEAVGDLQHIVAINPSAIEPAMQIPVLLYFGLNERQKGMDAVKRCLRGDPDSKPCFALLKEMKRLDKELGKVSQLVEKRSFSGAVKILVTPEKKSGESDDEPELGILDSIRAAAREHRQSGYLHPSAPEQLLVEALSLACSSFMEMDNDKRAQPHCTALLAHDSNALPALLHKAKAQISADDFEGALRTLEHAREHSIGGAASAKLREMHQEAQTLLKRSKTKDYYKTLDVSRDASERDIRKAYRRLSVQFHPDKVESPEARPAAEKKMAAINEAYEVLIDPELKARYDAGDDPNDPMSGHGGSPFQQGGFPGGFPFAGPMGGGRGQQFVFRSGPGGGGGGGGMPNFGQQRGGQGGFKFQFPGGGGFPGF